MINTKNTPSRPITDLEAVWKLIIPATLSLARIMTVTVSKLGKIRLPPSVWTRLISILSSSSGSGSSIMGSVTIFFVSPTRRRMYMNVCLLGNHLVKRLSHLVLKIINYKKKKNCMKQTYLSFCKSVNVIIKFYLITIDQSH